MTELKRTPLADWHRDNGARLVEFAGWEMPIRYEAGVLEEHRTVRGRCGIFDVSHMGEIEVQGADARAQVDRLVTNNVAALAVGQVLYSAMCNDRGTVLDDVLVYCLDEHRFLVVCNASNHTKVAKWMAAEVGGDAQLDDQTERTALFAIQGPTSLDALAAWSRLAPHVEALRALDYYHCTSLDLGGVQVLLSRTGYTGEKGYELYLPVSSAEEMWTEILAAGAAHGLAPIGLGARDTLRLEAGYSLYGHELDEEATPLESGIGWVVKLKAHEFVGREALLAQKESGVPRRTVALALPGRNIPRQGASVLHDGEIVGVITSGSFSPTLEQGIGLARVRADAKEGPLSVEIRGQAVEAQLAKLPFVPSRVKD